jgi:hypothetical protein
MKLLSLLGLVVMLLDALAHGVSMPPIEMAPGKEGLDITAERLPNGNMRFTATYKYSSGSFEDYQVSLSVVQVHVTDKGWDFSTKSVRPLPGEQWGKSIGCVFEITPAELIANPNLSFTIVKPNNGDVPATSPTWFLPLAKALLLRSEPSPGAQPLPDVKSTDGAALPPELLPMAREAEAESRRGNFARAEEIYLQVLEKAPNDLDTLSNLGVVLLRAGKGTLAEGPLKKAIALAPGRGFSHCVLGIAYYAEATFTDAISQLTKALAINPRSLMAHYYLGIVLGRMGYKDAAEKELQTAQELAPQNRIPRF